MKPNLASFIKTVLVPGALMLTSGLASAQVQRVETTTTTTSAAGTITEYGPQSVILHSEGAAPVRYSFSESTRYVDEEGNPVAATVIRSGLPATVYYTRTGDALVADRVVVRTRAAATVAPTERTEITTSTGVISDFGQDRFIIRSETSSDPLQYSYSRSTTYVDENGNPVAMETVRAGQPVTVQYTQVGDRLVASRVIVRKAAVAPASVIEERTRTTTTTTTRERDDDN